MSDYSHECPWCDAQYLTPPEGGHCSYCGGPGIRRIAKAVDPAPVVSQIVSSTHYYAPVTYNPVRRVKRWAFHTFGYRMVMVALALLVVVFVVWQIKVAFFSGATKPYDGPTIATVQPTRMFVEPIQIFEDVRFFRARESEVLRTQENVIHVAVLGGGYGVRYMVDYAVVLDHATWKKTEQVFGVTGFSPSDTSFTITVDVVTYALNKHQGFILADRPDTIYIVDDDNTIWEIDFSQDVLMPVADAQALLQPPIPSNSYLSLTLK